VGRRDNYRFELLAHPGWSRRAARYDDGLLAHSDSRPAHTEASPGRRPGPENENLPSPGPPAQTPPTTHRHTRYDSAGQRTSVVDALGYARYFSYDSGGNRHLEIDPSATPRITPTTPWPTSSSTRQGVLTKRPAAATSCCCSWRGRTISWGS